MHNTNSAAQRGEILRGNDEWEREKEQKFCYRAELTNHLSGDAVWGRNRAVNAALRMDGVKMKCQRVHVCVSVCVCRNEKSRRFVEETNHRFHRWLAEVGSEKAFPCHCTEGQQRKVPAH